MMGGSRQQEEGLRSANASTPDAQVAASQGFLPDQGLGWPVAETESA
ncbi:MAG: hypothetical protein NBV68_05435 [Erythrobacter sp.]|nr:hypothetical protein [Erythrobacter sp.]MCL9998801.1 hypothetical protein [Erythrobacter sp.]